MNEEIIKIAAKELEITEKQINTQKRTGVLLQISQMF